MELATGQWRREWAGTAEYGKVIEEGVTRHVARAMEVLNASTAGARVRVMRAAYHSSSGPGNPSASFLMHSSRRVISSGSSLLDSPTFMTKPLEISSIPLESSPERYLENNDYKVTEPDDTEISEPSKWRSSHRKETTKPISEESSSADNSSVIDLDFPMSISRHTNALRKFSLDSDLESEVSFSRKPVDRLSPLLDVPTTLSTLKYKSLLNGTHSSWNDRRKSYSFENTSPPNEGALGNNESKAIDSSTDSGICKSTDLLNESAPEKQSEMVTSQDGSFRDWLAKNRLRPMSRDYQHEVNNNTGDGKIALLSKGNVSISIPANNNPNDSYQYQSYNSHEEVNRKSKRVGFSKTELHFAAETGTVNIVATDNKPPPSKDYRKRRSAFVPIRNHFDKPITLFGDKKHSTDEEFNFNDYDLNEFDENASKKSILKNKIPKPKPYHLGTNTVIGELDENKQVSRKPKEYIIPVTQDTRSITPDHEAEAKGHQKAVKMIADRIEQENSLQNTFWDRQRKEKDLSSNYVHDENRQRENKVRQTLNKFQGSPILSNKTRVRPLRESDLAYFGVSESPKPIRKHPQYHKNSISSICSDTDDEFKSVKLIQQISNSVQNSESEYEESPRYQNLPFGKIITPVPKPRQQIADEASSNIEEKDQGTRRSKLRRENSDKISNSRSISEPPKQRLISRRAQQFTDSSVSSRLNNSSIPKNTKVDDDSGAITIRSRKKDNSPIYANLNYGENYNNVPIPIPSKRTTLEKREAREGTPQNVKATSQKAAPAIQNKTTPIEAQESKQITNDKKTLSMSHKNQRLSGHKTEKTERRHHETETNRSASKDRHEKKLSGKHKSKIQSDANYSPVSNNRGDDKDKVPKEHYTREKPHNKIETPETLMKKKSHYEHTRTSSPKRKIKEIVINYDDQNGTASLMPRDKHTAEKTNSTAKQKGSKLNKDSSKHDNRKTNTSEKRYLLDNEEGDDKWLRSGYIHASRKTKSRNAVQRTCEIL